MKLIDIIRLSVQPTPLSLLSYSTSSCNYEQVGAKEQAAVATVNQNDAKYLTHLRLSGMHNDDFSTYLL